MLKISPLQIKSNKGWFINCFNTKDRKWKKVYRMCLTSHEAYYNMELLERGDKLSGMCSTYRVVCVSIRPVPKKQLELF